MFAGDELVVSLADLLFEFFRDQIDCGVKVTLDIFGKEVRAWQRKAHGTGELSFGSLGLIMLEGDPGVDGETVEMRQLVNSANDMIFDGFGEGEIVRREDQIHAHRMARDERKIQ